MAASPIQLSFAAHSRRLRGEGSMDDIWWYLMVQMAVRRWVVSKCPIDTKSNRGIAHFLGGMGGSLGKSVGFPLN